MTGLPNEASADEHMRELIGKLVASRPGTLRWALGASEENRCTTMGNVPSA